MGKKLTVYMIDGTEYGPRFSEIGNRVGKAVYSPRATVNKIINRAEFDNPGIYCLKGDPTDEAFNEIVYIGEAENIKSRLKQHLSDPNKNFKELIFFISKDELFTKTQIRYLESRMVQIAINAKTAEIVIVKYLLVILYVPFLFISFNSTIPNSKNEKEDVPKGILVSVKELTKISKKARLGIEPHSTNVNLFLGFIDSLMQVSSDWPELSNEIIIAGRSSTDPIQLSSTGGKLVYGTAIAWHLTGDSKYAVKTKELILDLTKTYGYRNEEHKKFQWGAQGILNLARGGTPYIYAADLLEGWKGWTVDNKLKYQRWLRDIMYPKVAWASRTRKNNWGVAGSFSAALISYYLLDHPEWRLEEISPLPKKLTPEEAFAAHNRCQIGRMKTSADWKMDAKVALWGILPNGAIPEEIRRGKDPIDGAYLPSDGSGTHYTMTHIEHLTAHAEFLNRLGDSSLYDHLESDGSGSLFKAYMFVINNPIKPHCFTENRINALYMAYQYYKDPAMLRSLKNCGPGNISGQRLALFGRLTHPLNLSED